MPVRWIVFDAVGTLIHATPDVATVYAEIGRRHGSQLTPGEVAARFTKAFRESEERDLTGAGSEQANEASEEVRWRQIVAEVLPDVSAPDACFQDLFQHFGDPGSWACFDDVGPALERLARRDLQLAIASNFDARLHPVCDGLAELASIPQRVVSSEVGFRKPSRSFYDALLRQIGACAGEVLMVGDDPENDVRGAVEAGLKAVLIDRRDVLATRDTELAGEFRIVNSLLELDSLLS